MCQCHSQHLMRADLLMNRSWAVVCESNIFVCYILVDMNAKCERALGRFGLKCLTRCPRLCCLLDVHDFAIFEMWGKAERTQTT
jgi:hypothetical protein